MWLLILQFIMAIPQLIKVVMEIWRLIKELRDDDTDKVLYTNNFKDILAAHRRQSTEHTSERLDYLLAHLKAKLAGNVTNQNP